MTLPSRHLIAAKVLWKLNRLSHRTQATGRSSTSQRDRGVLSSCPCTQAQLESERFRAWAARMREQPAMHRKQWEFCYIAQALEERGLLRPGTRGLGFAVGREPLPSLFASYGVEILASDLSEDADQATGWMQTGQHAGNLDILNERGICPPDLFQRRVTFRAVDMNQVPDDLGGFDFLWSSCSLEHLGSIDNGERFIYRAMECLKPGGIAVHTTEYNVSSNTFTLDHHDSVLFRRRDIERIARSLTAAGHHVELDFSEGDLPFDSIVDTPPYTLDPHLKLLISHYVSTSFGLIIQRK